jgi:hypothetical protein
MSIASSKLGLSRVRLCVFSKKIENSIRIQNITFTDIHPIIIFTAMCLSPSPSVSSSNFSSFVVLY